MTTFADLPLTVTIEEAAKMLGVGRSCAYSAVKAGDFPVPVIKVGRRLLVSRHRLEELLGVPENGSPAEETESTGDQRPSIGSAREKGYLS